MTPFVRRCGNGPFRVGLMRQLEKRCGNAARRVPRKNPALLNPPKKNTKTRYATWACTCGSCETATAIATRNAFWPARHAIVTSATRETLTASGIRGSSPLTTGPSLPLTQSATFPCKNRPASCGRFPGTIRRNR